MVKPTKKCRFWGSLRNKHNLMIVNEDRQKRDPTFTPIFFHALSDETKISRHLRPKFAEKSTFSKETNFNFFIFSLLIAFLHRKLGEIF